MAHLLWPTRTEQYFLLTSHRLDPTEELDEFNEAPHVIHGTDIPTNDRQQLVPWDQLSAEDKYPKTHTIIS